MVAIHPDIEALLAVLDRAGLTTLADIARARLDDADDRRLSELRGWDSKESIPPDFVFELQRDTVAMVVGTIVQRELKMRRRIRERAIEFRLNGMVELGPTDMDVAFRFEIVDNFTSKESEVPLTEFLTAWNDIIRDLGGQPGEFHAG